MARQHSERWFSKQERLLTNEPMKNTRKYYCHILQFFKFAFIIPTVRALQYVRYANIFREQSTDYLGSSRAVTLTGAPGVGKTFSSINFAISLAETRWSQLQSDYILQSGMIDRWIQDGEIDKIISYRAIEESYLFYKSREEVGIPCLVSSIPIKDQYGRFSYTLTPEVPLQLVRLPEYTVIFNDESGLTQGANTSKTAGSNVRDFYRFNRHFGDFMFINTEQGSDQNAKYMRIVTDHNIRLRRQEWIMKPEIALWRLEKAKAKFFRRRGRGKYAKRPEREQYIIEKLYYREMYLRTIGFRAIPYRYEQSEGNAVNDEHGVYIFPAGGMAQYDARTYRNLYKCKDETIDIDIYRSLIVEENADPHKFDDQITAA